MNGKNRIFSNNFLILVISLFFMEFIRGMFVLGYVPMLPTKYFNISLLTTSIIMAIHFTADALTNFVIGIFLKRINSKVIINFGFILIIISFIFMSFFPKNILILIATSIVLGISASPIWVIVLSNIGIENRGKKMGIVYFNWMIGLLFGMASINLIFSFLSLKTPILITIVSIFSFFIFQFYKGTRLSSSQSKLKFKKLIKLTYFYSNLIPGIIIQAISISSLVPILPKFAINYLRIDNFLYTSYLIIGIIFCSFSMLYLSKFIDKLKREKSFMLSGFLIFGISILSLALITNTYLILVITIVIGLIYGVILPMWNKYMASFVSDQHREESWGLFNSIQGLGSLVGMPIGGILTKITNNIVSPFYFAGILIIILVLIYLKRKD